jgi:hypothetical protein
MLRKYREVCLGIADDDDSSSSGSLIEDDTLPAAGRAVSNRPPPARSSFDAPVNDLLTVDPSLAAVLASLREEPPVVRADAAALLNYDHVADLLEQPSSGDEPPLGQEDDFLIDSESDPGRRFSGRPPQKMRKFARPTAGDPTGGPRYSRKFS